MISLLLEVIRYSCLKFYSNNPTFMLPRPERESQLQNIKTFISERWLPFFTQHFPICPLNGLTDTGRDPIYAAVSHRGRFQSNFQRFFVSTELEICILTCLSNSPTKIRCLNYGRIPKIHRIIFITFSSPPKICRFNNAILAPY